MEPIFTNELRNKLTPGNKIKIFYNEGNHNNQLRYIRSIVDEDYVVYKVWSKYKQAWRYHVVWIYDFLLLDNGGCMKVVK